ncbi:MAG: hypothetical protein KF752_09300 [Pirellulaceae bacterium]|nr:hypothetical protein [Pirellulaceae bacterium]
MTFFADPAYGRWHCCAVCSANGGLADLVKRISGKFNSDAQRWLEVNVPAALVDNLGDFCPLAETTKRLQLLNEIWNQCQSRETGKRREKYSEFQISEEFHLEQLCLPTPRLTDDQMRLITRADLEPFFERMTEAERDTFLQSEASSFWVLRGYRLPGRIASLCLVDHDRPNSQPHILLTDTANHDPGLLIHPATALANSNVILIDDLNWYLSAARWHYRHSNTRNPFGYYFDHPGQQTNDIRMLLTRHKLLWCSKPSANSLRMAARLNCSISHFGHADGEFNDSTLKILKPKTIFNELVSKAHSWRVEAAKFVENNALLQATEFLREAQLSHAQRLELQELLPSGLVCELEAHDPNHCPVKQIATPQGLLEQSPAGWALYRKNLKLSLCCYPWRIKGTFFELEPSYQVDVFYKCSWRSLRIPISKLQRDPLGAISSAMVDNKMVPIHGTADFKKHFINFANLLNPIPDQPIEQSTIPLGFDFRRSLLRTSRLEISASPASLQTVQLISHQPGLLPLADDVLPNAHTLSAILESQGIWRTLNAVVLQALRYLTGLTPMAITFGQQTRHIVSAVLGSLGLTDHNTDWPCSLHLEDFSNRKRLPKGACKADFGIWHTLSSKQTYWLAGLRPVLPISERRFDQLEIGDLELQRATVHLLHGALEKLQCRGQTHTQALEEAWQRMLTLAGCRHTTLPIIFSPLTAQDAVLYWTQRAIEANYFQLLERRIARPTARTVISTNEILTIPLSGLNTFISQNYLSRWNLELIEKQLRGSAHFEGVVVRNRLKHLRFAAKVLEGHGLRDCKKSIYDPGEEVSDDCRHKIAYALRLQGQI